MKFHHSVLWVVILLGALSACVPVQPWPGQGQRPSPEQLSHSPPTRTHGGSIVNLPGIQATAADFLTAWQAEDYSRMHSLLTSLSRDAIPLERMTAFYRGVANTISLTGLDFEILSALARPQSAQVAYRVTVHTSLVGDITRDLVMNLLPEDGTWKVQWEESLVFPELGDGNYLMMDLQIPARANIYARGGEALAAQTSAYALGLIPSEVQADQETLLLTLLSRLTGIPLQTVQVTFEQARGSSDYLPIGEALAQDVDELYSDLAAFSGLRMARYTARFYYDSGIAPHVTGFVQPIPAERVEEFQRRGYRVDEKVGMTGLERWGEPFLIGQRGASLYVVMPSGHIVTRLAQVDSEPSQAVYATIDRELQLGVQRTIEGFKGAVVVLERDSGRVLALASAPGFDPNTFEPTNANSRYLIDALFDPVRQPLLNRATQGAYPLGSVFKIITMAAALESGFYTDASTYNCGHTFTDLPGITLYDWTYSYRVAPSGLLTLSEALMRSCNPWYYHIGLTLFEAGQENLVVEMARQFGLGEPTGIEIEEGRGSVIAPTSGADAVQQSIGQGTLLVTPLQVAAFVAAIGNGGTLYRPSLVDRVVSPRGDTQTFEPEARRLLPLSDSQLASIQAAMRSVVDNPRGTAFGTFSGLSIPVYGKTGTAQNAGGAPHAWFAGYTNSDRTDRPNIAVVVLAENAGEGSVVAAPIFRRVIELYYDGKATRLYPWEADYFITQTPTPTESGSLQLTPSP
ncbi:MAG TPA: penicillin-binding transpeptidase domain-containing protein [Levilinea sp.]|nr:penicillin-binding transpeptidase domain-containing protein [Levilinea sp.]